MGTMNDVAKIFYWGCVIWPLVGMIGLFACDGQAARARCHYAISFVLIFIAACSAALPDDFFLSATWSNDGLTRYLRLLIAIGAGISTILLTYWQKRSLFFIKEDKRSLWNLLLFHLLIMVSMLAVGANNLFVAFIFIVILAALLFMGCILKQGESCIKAGWIYFRLVLSFVSISLVAAFLLSSVPVEGAPLLAPFSSALLSLGMVLLIGIFPMSFFFMELIAELPAILGSLGSFIISIPAVAMFLRLYQIPHYQPSENLLLVLGLISLTFIVIFEQNRQRSSLYLSSLLLTTMSFFGSVFAQHVEGIYSACLFLMALVFLAPLGYMLGIKDQEFNSSKSAWVGLSLSLSLSLSGLPPIGIFTACSVLFSYLIQKAPMAGWCVLFLFLFRGYYFFRYKVNFSNNFNFADKGVQLIFGILVLQTFLMPLLISSWLHQIAITFVSHQGEI